MKSNPNNLYHPADDSSQVRAFNSNLSFPDTAHEVSKADREVAEDAITRMIDATKSQISKGH